MKKAEKMMKKLLVIGLLVGFSINTCSVGQAFTKSETDLSITFTEGSQGKDKPVVPPKKDDVPKIQKEKVISRQSKLPQTGEVAKQLGVLLTGLLLVLIVFIWFRNKQGSYDTEEL